MHHGYRPPGADKHHLDALAATTFRAASRFVNLPDSTAIRMRLSSNRTLPPGMTTTPRSKFIALYRSMVRVEMPSNLATSFFVNSCGMTAPRTCWHVSHPHYRQKTAGCNFAGGREEYVVRGWSTHRLPGDLPVQSRDKLIDAFGHRSRLLVVRVVVRVRHARRRVTKT